MYSPHFRAPGEDEVSCNDRVIIGIMSRSRSRSRCPAMTDLVISYSRVIIGTRIRPRPRSRCPTMTDLEATMFVLSEGKEGFTFE